MDSRMIQPRKMAVERFLTCFLCRHILVEATTINECLHTFCRKCITKKFTEDEATCCPVCNTELGDAPLDKLRPDHHLQRIRSVLYPTSPCEEPTGEKENTSLNPTEAANITAQNSRFNPIEASNLTAPHVRLQNLSISESLNHQIPSNQSEKNLSTTGSSSGQQGREAVPIWISLVASPSQRESGSFPQLSKRYIKVDGSATVLFIHKYLMTKLNLASEDQVEILCYGELISPSMPISALRRWWVRKQPSHRIKVKAGSSAKQFGMELYYRPKIHCP